MERSSRTGFRFAVVAIVAVAAVAAVRAGSPAWEQRLEAYRSEQWKVRSQSKESAEILDQKYGTPEVTFAEPRCAAPGETATVTLPGKLAPGSLVVVESDAVKVASEKLGAKGWEAKVAVPADSPPGPIHATVVAPVTTRQVAGPLLSVCGKYELALALEGGLALRVAPSGDAHVATWTRPPATTSLRQGPAKVEAHGHGSLSVELAEDPAAMQARAQAVMGGEEMAILQESQTACDPKGPIEKFLACMQGYQKKAEAARQKRLDRAAKEVPPCGRGNLELAGGKVTGWFKRCDEDLPEVAVTGTYRLAGK